MVEINLITSDGSFIIPWSVIPRVGEQLWFRDINYDVKSITHFMEEKNSSINVYLLRT